MKREKPSSIIFIDDIIRYCFEDIFQSLRFDIFKGYAFKLTRDSELNYEDDISRSFFDKLKTSLKKREQGEALRFVYDERMPKSVLDLLFSKLSLKRSAVTSVGGWVLS